MKKKHEETYEKYIEAQEKLIELERSDYYLSMSASDKIFYKNTMLSSIELLRKELKDLEIMVRIEEDELGLSNYKSGKELYEDALKILDNLTK